MLGSLQTEYAVSEGPDFSLLLNMVQVSAEESSVQVYQSSGQPLSRALVELRCTNYLLSS